MLGLVYPALGFALWHLSPQLVFPAENGLSAFVLSTFALGLCYGWTAYRTGSIKRTALSHSLNGILAFGMPVSTSILRLIIR
jgi:membrane protease YdiL (CAAX protease family)